VCACMSVCVCVCVGVGWLVDGWLRVRKCVCVHVHVRVHVRVHMCQYPCDKSIGPALEFSGARFSQFLNSPLER